MKITMTVYDIIEYNLWTYVCMQLDLNPYILNEGRIDCNDTLTFEVEGIIKLNE